MNASFGKFVRSRSVGLLVRLMRDRQGTLLVGAAGNEDTLTMEYPAAFTDAVAVSAVDRLLRKETFSNFGRWIDVSAPGAQLLSALPGASVGAKSGTSMAAPLVAGVAGLMLANNPQLSFGDLRRWLLESADPSFYSSTFEDGFNYRNYYPRIPGEGINVPLLGVGVLNAANAVQQIPTGGQPIAYALDRVEPGCSTIGAARGGVAGGALLLLMLAAPLAFVRACRRGARRS
jgi:subtilisin family serine protease